MPSWLSSKARHMPLAEGEEYWPQGCLTLPGGSFLLSLSEASYVFLCPI